MLSSLHFVNDHSGMLKNECQYAVLFFLLLFVAFSFEIANSFSAFFTVLISPQTLTHRYPCSSFTCLFSFLQLIIVLRNLSQHPPMKTFVLIINCHKCFHRKKKENPKMLTLTSIRKVKSVGVRQNASSLILPNNWLVLASRKPVSSTKCFNGVTLTR